MDTERIMARTVGQADNGTLHVETGERKDAKVAMYAYTESGMTVLFRVWDGIQAVVIRVVDLYKGLRMTQGCTFAQQKVTERYLGRLRVAITLETDKKIIVMREDETNGEQ